MKLSIWFFVDSVPFTKDIVEGRASLGGSESACKGTAEGLARLGHDVKIFATNLSAEAPAEHEGVLWLPAEQFRDVLKFAAPDVFCSLRTVNPFFGAIPARLNLLWNQDLLTSTQAPSVLAGLPQVDHMVYVSEYHRHQWETGHDYLAPMGHVTRNGIDPTQTPNALTPDSAHWADGGTVKTDPNRLIYVSRPERGLEPLLDMWPTIKARWPEASLAFCRYQSMYDGEGTNVRAMMDRADAKIAAMNDSVGGLVTLGALGKRDLYREIARASMMIYPGVAEFAETGCIAATEAQACGTPILASRRGALEEAVHPDAGILFDGDASTPEYQADYIAALLALRDDRARQLSMRDAGFAWAHPRYHFDTIAAEWNAWLHETFTTRYEANKPAVMRQLLHWDNAAACRMVAKEIAESPVDHPEKDVTEALDMAALCDRVIAQEEQTAEDYAIHAVQYPEREAAASGRIRAVAEDIAALKPARIMDLACGNGSMALLLAQWCPDATIDAFDYSENVLKLGTAASERLGFDDRITFHQSAWDDVPIPAEKYDALFCGEFLEHVEKPWELLDYLEQFVTDDGAIFLTTPCGPFGELIGEGIPYKRGHIHAFSVRDIAEMGGPKRDFRYRYMDAAITFRGNTCGFWLLRYRPGGGSAAPVDYDREIVTTRPYQRLTAAMIVKDGSDTLRKCLRSLYNVVDRVFIYDTGSTDNSVEIATQLGAEVVQGDWPEHFAEARNRALDAVEKDSEWILWLDADEILDNAPLLRQFVTGAGPFLSYAMAQTHLTVDVPVFSDYPHRVFRANKGIRFYGAVHEQPETAPDMTIHPALRLDNPQAPRILHFGYYSDGLRRDKLINRNLNLLRKELKSEHPRELAYVLLLRDCCNFAQFEIEQHQRMTPKASQFYQQAIELMQARFLDPTHKYHDLAWPYYQTALEAMGAPVIGKWAFAASGTGHMKGAPRVETVRALSAAELQRVTSAKIKTWTDQLQPEPIETRPLGHNVVELPTEAVDA